MRDTEIELVTYSIEREKDEKENYRNIATTIFSGETTIAVNVPECSPNIRKPENSTPLQTSLIFNDLADLPPLPVVDPVQLTTWEPLVSPDNCDWVRGELTEEQQWLHSLKVPKEWLENRKTDYTESPTVSRRRTVKKIKTSKDSCEDSARVGGGVGGWYLLRHHHQSLVARGVAMTLNRNVSSFTSYIDLESSDQKDPVMDTLPDLLPGEMVISQAERVCVYSTHVGGMTSGQTGALFVTTLKLSFKFHVEKEVQRNNKILGDTDVPLSSIQAVYEIWGDSGEKRKKLPLGSNVANKIDGIFILCKNFRFLRFSFKFAGVDTGRNITNALLHHSRPKKNELLFAFEHSLNTPLHTQYGAVWEDVRSESECPNMRVSRANESWQVSTSLPQQFIVPGHVTDESLCLISGLCLGTRPPVWVWGNKIGGAIFIQPVLNVTPSANVDQMMDDFFRTKKKITVDLDHSFPNNSQLEDSFISLLELHCVDGEKEAEEKDKNYFSSLESTGWLSSVGSSLRIASQVAELVINGKTVILREGEGRSSSILISSLAQILLCEDFRTRSGFEGLIRSNWISLGFQFSKNHALSNLSNKVSNLNPTFLLFLDCVHQLGLQFPSKLEFLPQYLIDLWDTVLLPVFDTFIFDSEHDRAVARSSQENPLQLHSAWDWAQQFTPQHIAKWENPLFGVPLRPPRSTSGDPSDLSMIMSRQAQPTFPESKKFLPVSGDVINLSVWYSMFHRSVPFLSSTNCWTDRLTDLRREAKTSVASMMNTTRRQPVNSRNNHKEDSR